MPDFSQTIHDILDGRVVRVGHLVEFWFGSPQRLWNGFRNIKTSDDKVWYGIGGLGSISGLEDEHDNLQSTEMRLVVSGVDSALLQTAISEDRSLYVGKLVIVYLLFFNKDWQPLDLPVARKAGIIDGIDVSHVGNEDGTRTRTIGVTAQNIFFGRSVPPAAYYSNRDQQFRKPGDRGLEFISDSMDTVIQIPW